MDDRKDAETPVDPKVCQHPIMHRMEEQILVSTNPRRKIRGRTFCGLCNADILPMGTGDGW